MREENLGFDKKKKYILITVNISNIYISNKPFQCRYTDYLVDDTRMNGYDKKCKRWCLTTPPISTKQTTTSHIERQKNNKKQTNKQKDGWNQSSGLDRPAKVAGLNQLKESHSHS